MVLTLWKRLLRQRVFNLARGYEGLMTANDQKLANMVTKRNTPAKQTHQFASIINA